MRTAILVLLAAIAIALAMPSSVSAVPVNGSLPGIAGGLGVEPEPVVVCRTVRQRVCRAGRCYTRAVRRCT
jgi:hypothetical protein